jgi:hypothetical protein
MGLLKSSLWIKVYNVGAQVERNLSNQGDRHSIPPCPLLPASSWCREYSLVQQLQMRVYIGQIQVIMWLNSTKSEYTPYDRQTPFRFIAATYKQHDHFSCCRIPTRIYALSSSTFCLWFCTSVHSTSAFFWPSSYHNSKRYTQPTSLSPY